MKRILAFILPLVFIFIASQFKQEYTLKSMLQARTGKLWTTLFSSSGQENGFVSKYPLVNDTREQVLRYLNNNDLFSSDNLSWQLPFTGDTIAEVVIPFRINAQGTLIAAKEVQSGEVKPAAMPIIVKQIVSPQILAYDFEQYEKAITIVANQKTLIPYRSLDTLSFASLSIGQPQGNTFQEYLDKYVAFQHFAIARKDTSSRAYESLLEKLSKYKVVVVGLHGLNASAGQAYGIPQATRTFLERLRTRTNITLVVFGTPYSLKYFDRIEHLLCAYEDNDVTQTLVPQVLFGALPAVGRLPVTVSQSLPAGAGETTQTLKRLGYTVPERLGMQTPTLKRIDRIVEACIKDSVMPGAQILVAKNGRVIYEKAYGYLTYDKKEPVTNRTLYDLASVTKVAATLQAVMALQAKGGLDVKAKISDYLPELKGTNKEHILIQDLLLHQAGLLAFQDHWTRTKVEADFDTTYYSYELDELHPLVVATGLYGISSLKDSLWHWTIKSRLLKKPQQQKAYPYKYSDIGFDILQQIVERQSNQSLDDYLDRHFYRSLGLDELTFNPLNKFKESNIAPTEQDKRFRGKLVRGTVHDQEAALMGGVAGHAGLFGNANSLAILMQMNLQKGYYGGKRYFPETTIPNFTKTYQPNNRRGLGWDRPNPEGGGGLSDLASRNSFGHTGFTGTCVWIDPDQELVYIFLSNRVYPNAENNKLARYKVREKIQSVVYESMNNPKSLVADVNKNNPEAN
jgi:CubicO group peptidase (beta-lactamase class C family)